LLLQLQDPEWSEADQELAEAVMHFCPCIPTVAGPKGIRPIRVRVFLDDDEVILKFYIIRERGDRFILSCVDVEGPFGYRCRLRNVSYTGEIAIKGNSRADPGLAARMLDRGKVG
jgi:hypothetical protein